MLTCASPEKSNKPRKEQKAAGFTLLEVLVALSLLAIVALAVIRACGEGLIQVGDSGWADTAVRIGRAKMYEVVLSGGKGNLQGTFAPQHPEMRWQAHVHDLQDLPGRRMEFVITEGEGKARHEVAMEQILYP